MPRLANLRSLSCLLLVIFVVSACNSADTPEPPTPTARIAALPTDTPTSAPTVPLPTAGPTNTPAPPTATPTLVATNTPTPQPSPTPQVHVVTQDDTLLDIAIQHGTTVEAILAANGISEEDFLQLGQELVIPPPEGETVAGSGAASNADVSASSGEQAAITGSGQAAAANPAGGQGFVSPYSWPVPLPVELGPPVPPLNRVANINPLTGQAVSDPSVLAHRPLMVRVGNDTGARASQLGLNRAAVVYEEITEWWVTRFSAIFYGEIPETVGPIRSARLINTQIGPQYQAAVAHSGGSDPVRWQMTQIPITNLDQWFHESVFFHRPNEGWMTRAAFKAGEAYGYLAQKGLDAAVKLRGFTFSPTISKGEAAPTIFIPFPRATTFTQWTYNPASGKYLRFANDAPLVDSEDGKQIAASNVIVYFAPHQETDIVEDSNGGLSLQITMMGRGPAWFFRDGKLNKGYWQTDGTQTPFFTYEDGTPYPLKPGNTWIQVVPTYYKIGLNSADEASSRP